MTRSVIPAPLRFAPGPQKISIPSTSKPVAFGFVDRGSYDQAVLWVSAEIGDYETATWDVRVVQDGEGYDDDLQILGGPLRAEHVGPSAARFFLVGKRVES